MIINGSSSNLAAKSSEHLLLPMHQRWWTFLPASAELSQAPAISPGSAGSVASMSSLGPVTCPLPQLGQLDRPGCALYGLSFPAIVTSDVPSLAWAEVRERADTGTISGGLGLRLFHFDFAVSFVFWWYRFPFGFCQSTAQECFRVKKKYGNMFCLWLGVVVKSHCKGAGQREDVYTSHCCVLHDDVEYWKKKKKRHRKRAFHLIKESPQGVASMVGGTLLSQVKRGDRYLWRRVR